MEDVRLVAEGLVFPEGPVAMPDGSVVVVELKAGRLSRVTPSGAIEVIAQCGLAPNGAAVGPDGMIYVCNNGGAWPDEYRGGRIQRVDPTTGSVDDLYTQCDGRPLSAPNDLVFDRHGNFWFTDLGKIRTRDRDRGGIFYASPDGTMIREVFFPADAPNGIGLSPDGSTLYWAETFTGRVYQRSIDPLVAEPIDHLDPTGLLHGAGGRQMFDSLAVDGDGNVCVGTLVDSGITVISPDGADVQRLALPAPFVDPLVTNICFGGDDLRTAYITLSESGCLVSCRWPRPGLRLAF